MLRDIPLGRHRNIGIIAHIDAGKTTCTERMLFYAGRIHRLGEVHYGDTEMDYTPQEQEMGITITAAATSLSWKAGSERHLVNLIDTPGHVDFTVEVERSLRVLDGAVAIFDAEKGVEPQSETVWRQADRYQVPRIAFINKMDKVGASFTSAVASIRERLGARAIPVQLPLGEEGDHRGVIDLIGRRAFVFDDAAKGVVFEEVAIPEDLRPAVEAARASLCEAAADADDGILTKVIDGRVHEISVEEIARALRQLTITGRAVPVLCGSAHKNKGIQMLLDAVCAYLPSPLDVGSVRGHDPKTGAEIERPVDDGAPLAALAFKVMSLDKVGSVTVLRVYSGCLRRTSSVLDASTGVVERIGRLALLHANKLTDVDVVGAGSIAAVIGLRQVRTGATLSDPRHPIVLGGLSVPEPVVELAIEPRGSADQEKLGRALARLAIEDPSFRIEVASETGQTVLRGMGELHLALLVDRLKREHGVETITGRPRVAYRETIARRAVGEHRLIKQSGGPGQYAYVALAIAPAERGAGFSFRDESPPGSVRKDLVPAIEQGIRGAMSRGVLLGYPMVDVEVALVGGSFHAVDSKGPAFEVAASMAFKKAAEAAEPYLLEPIMQVEVIAPEEHVGDVLSDVQARRGTVQSLATRANARVVTALVPLRALFGHVDELRSKTRGRASASMVPSHYAPVPPAIQASVAAS